MAKTAKKNLQDDENQAPITAEPELSPAEPAPEQETMFEPEPEATAAPPEPEPPKKFKGRPRNDETPPPNVIEVMRSYTSWEGRTVYVYRKFPITDRKTGDNTLIHCAKYERCIDEQDLLNDLGSGVYQIRVIYDDPLKPGDRKTVAKADVRVMNIQYPPKIPRIESMWEDSRNKDWLWAKDMLDKQDAATVAKQVVQDSGTALMAPLLAMMEKQNERQAAELAEIRKQQREAANAPKVDPNAGWMAILGPLLPAIIERLLAPPPTPPPPPEPKQTPLEALAMSLLTKQLTEKPEKEEGRMSALKEYAEVSKSLDELRPEKESRARSRMEGWQEFTQGLVHELAPVLQPVVQIVAMTIAQKQREAQEEAAAKKAQQPGARPAKVAAIRPPSEPEPQPQTEQPATGPKVLTDVEFAQEVVGALEENESGSILAEWYAEEFGIDEYTEAKAQGKEKLLADIRAVSQTKSALATFDTTGALDKLITEFLTWVPETEQQDEEDEPDEPQPAAAAPIQNSNPWIKPAATVNQEPT